jgi:uncharacterized protein (TIGR00369 family)
MADIKFSDMCFGCGPRNPFGLHLKIKHEEWAAEADWLVTENYVSYDRTMHGGIFAALADEIMGHVTPDRREVVVTAHLEVDFLAAAHVGDALHCAAKMTSIGNRSIHTEAVISAGDKILARAKGVYVRMQ